VVPSDAGILLDSLGTGPGLAQHLLVRVALPDPLDGVGELVVPAPLEVLDDDPVGRALDDRQATGTGGMRCRLDRQRLRVVGDVPEVVGQVDLGAAAGKRGDAGVFRPYLAGLDGRVDDLADPSVGVDRLDEVLHSRRLGVPVDEEGTARVDAVSTRGVGRAVDSVVRPWSRSGRTRRS